MQEYFDAIVLAGANRGQNDPLTAQLGESNKALIKIHEHPMVWYVLRALSHSRLIGQIVLVGLDENDADGAGVENGIDFKRPVHYLPDQGDLLANVAGAFKTLGQWQEHDRHALVLTADTPLITGAMIDWFLDHCLADEHLESGRVQKDVYWGIVERAVMEASFPQGKRTYVRLAEGQFCSGDIFLGRIKAALSAQGPIQEVLDNRKDTIRQIRLLGFGNLVKYLGRRLAVKDVLEVVHRMSGMDGAPIVLPYAEMGMDVDKPDQLSQARGYLFKRPDVYSIRHVGR